MNTTNRALGSQAGTAADVEELWDENVLENGGEGVSKMLVIAKHPKQ